MATFSNRTVNETYRQARMDGADDAAARVRVKARLLEIYGSEPDDAALDEASTMYDQWRAGEQARIDRERAEIAERLSRLDARSEQLKS